MAKLQGGTVIYGTGTVLSGLTVGGNLNVGGTLSYSTITGILSITTGSFSNLSITSYLPSSSTATGALTVAGGAGIGGNLYVGGIFYGGPQQSLIGLSSPLMVLTNNVNSYTQIQIQNTNTGAIASSDFVATADVGSDGANYIDMGINNSGYSTSSWTISGAKDGYLYVDGGNLTLGTDAPGKNVSIHVGGTLASNIVATFSSGTVSASTATGALVVYGGLGVAGNINAGGFIVSTSTRVTGLSTFTNTLEIMNNVGSVSGVTSFLFNAGQTYYVSPSATWSIALYGVPTDPINYSTIVTFLVNQGTTPYTATQITINGTAVTPKWSGGVVWPGNASHTDIVAYGIVNIGGTFNIYAQYSSF